METTQMSTIEKFLRVAVEPRTYLNIIYLFLSFPLGIVYLVLFCTGISLSAGLLVIFIGVLIFWLMLEGTLLINALERYLSVHLLGQDIPAPKAVLSGKGFFGRFGALLKYPPTWKGLIFLPVRFALGTVNFIAAITGFAVSLGLMATPLLYRLFFMNFINWPIETTQISILLSIIGIGCFFITLHLLNLLAFINGKLNRLVCEE